MAELGVAEESEGEEPAESVVPLTLPFARRDIDKLRLGLMLQDRLAQAPLTSAQARLIRAKAFFPDALQWLEVHGQAESREVAAWWRGVEIPEEPPAVAEPLPSRPREGRRVRPPVDDAGAPASPETVGTDGAAGSRRRRRRRRRRPTPPQVES